MILSVTEGDDKPLKYPHMFRAADLMILNKIDLLPHVDFDVSRAIANATRINPEIATLEALRPHRRGAGRMVRLAPAGGRGCGRRGFQLT